MKTLKNIVLIALFTGSAFFLVPNFSFGQFETIELIKGADDIRLDAKNNIIIKGNVVFVKDGAKLYCDSAYYSVKNETISAYHNVHLNKQDTLNLYCDSLFFDFEKRFAKLWGNVRVRDNEYKLTTDSLDYDLEKDMGVYKNGGEITSISSSDKLNSKIGYFYPKTEQFNFRTDVVYTNDELKVTTDTLQFNGMSKKANFFGPTHIESEEAKMYCEKGWYHLNNEEGVLESNAFIDRKDIYISSDSLYYSSIDSLYIASRNVQIKDTTNKLTFKGDFARSEMKRKMAFITGHALAEKYGTEDTVYIHADTLFNYNDSLDEPSLIQAYNEVNLFRGEMQGKCDSLTYNRQNEQIDMFISPVLWLKGDQLSGDTISIYDKGNEKQMAYIRDKGIVVNKVKRSNYYNQVAGTSMKAFIDSSEIRRVDINKNAKTIYFLEEESDQDTVIVVERKGMNRLYSSDISLYFKDGDISGATYRSEPDGILYPMNKIKQEEERTTQFHWTPEAKPISPTFMILDDDEKAFLRIFLRQSLNF